MALLLRRPFVLASALRQTPKPASIALRAYHNSPFRPAPKTLFTAKISAPSLSQSSSVFRNTFRAFRRTYSQQSATAANPEARQRLIYNACILGGAFLVLNFAFNRETRDHEAIPSHELSYLNDTFTHVGLGLGTIALGARTLHHSGWSYRLMAANPWLVFGVGLVGSIGSMYACLATSPESKPQKYALWGVFNLTQAALLSPLMFLQPALLARAGLYTAGMMGTLALVGATAKNERYLYYGGPLLAALAVVAASGFAPMVLPATATRALLWTENIWLYGGLAVFGGLTLYDVQKVLHNARKAEMGLIKRDPVNEAIGLELDFINIFVRMVQILGMQQGKRK